MIKEYPFELFKFGEAKKVDNAGQEAVARSQGYTEPYKFQEYPKHLYKGGAREVHEVSGNEVSAVVRIVRNKQEEEAARAAGYRTLGEPEPEADDAKVQPKAKKAA